MTWEARSTSYSDPERASSRCALLPDPPSPSPVCWWKILRMMSCSEKYSALKKLMSDIAIKLSSLLQAPLPKLAWDPWSPMCTFRYDFWLSSFSSSLSSFVSSPEVRAGDPWWQQCTGPVLLLGTSTVEPFAILPYHCFVSVLWSSSPLLLSLPI